MKDQINTIREALTLSTDGPIIGRDDMVQKALTALTQLEAMAGEPVAWTLTETLSKRETTTNAYLWFSNPVNSSWTPLYTATPVAQQPQEIEVQCPVCNHKFYEWPNDKQPQAEPDIHEAQGQIEFLDKKNNALSAAIRKVMARLADLLDEDQFKEIEEIVSFAGVQPQAEAVPLTHVLVPVDEPTDEMVDAACAAVDGLCRVDFVRAYVAAFAHLKAGYRDESYWCGWNAAIKFQQAEAVPVVDRVYEAAKRLVDHADFQLGGVLSAKSKARDIPSNAASKVKARHLASLRDALAKTPQQAEAVPQAAEFCWLVEHFDIADKSTGHYYTGKVGIADRAITTMDPHQAKRYDTWKEANIASAQLGSTLTGTWRAMQHGFHRMEPQRAEAVLPTHVLVPVEPTDAMVQAAHHLDLSYMPGHEGSDRAAVYRAMVAAAIAQQKGSA